MFFSELPTWLPIILVFIFGTAIGSFLNVLVWRLPREESILGRSYCPQCKRQLVWHDLLPVASILMQRGRCKYCEKRISLRYPLIEVLVGFLFALAWWLFPVVDLPTAIVFLKVVTVVALCVAVFIIDLEHYLILDRIVFPGVSLMFVFALATDLSVGGFHNTISSLLSAAAVFILFWVMWYSSKWFLGVTGKWMGLGDVKFVAFMGLALGFPNIVVALFLSFTIGAVVGIFLIIIGEKQLGSKIPFGTFLSAATVLALFWGPELLNYYWRLFSIG